MGVRGVLPLHNRTDTHFQGTGLSELRSREMRYCDNDAVLWSPVVLIINSLSSWLKQDKKCFSHHFKHGYREVFSTDRSQKSPVLPARVSDLFLRILSSQGPEQLQLVCGIVLSLSLVLLVYLNLYLPNESTTTEHPLETRHVTAVRTNEIQPSLECKNL